MPDEKVVYRPGEEPEWIRRRIEQFIQKMDEAYPDKVVVSLHKKHNYLSRKSTEFCHTLGYHSREDFLMAYGYKVEHVKYGRGKQISKSDSLKVLNELKRRYPNGSDFITVAELVHRNSDMRQDLKRFQRHSNEHFGLSFAKLLRQQGILRGATRIMMAEEAIVVLKKKYGNAPFKGWLADLKYENDTINWPALNYYVSGTGTSLKRYLIQEGILESANTEASSFESLEENGTET